MNIDTIPKEFQSEMSELLARHQAEIRAKLEEFESRLPKEKTVEEDIQLTDSQKAALESLTAWVEDPNEMFFVLQGAAGTGKSFMTRLFHKMITDHGYIVRQAAPTHKAANVLAKSSGFPAATLASLMALRAVMESEETTFEDPEEWPIFPPRTILIIDEASAVSEETLASIHSMAKARSLRVIFVLDPAQTSPINETRPPVRNLLPSDSPYSSVLYEVRRYGGPVLELATLVRKGVFTSEGRREYFNETRLLNSPCGKVRTVNHLDFDGLLDSFLNGSTKYVAWRNSRVDETASIIQSSLGFNTFPSVGDLFNVRGRLFSTSGQEIGFPEDEVRIMNASPDRDFTIHDCRIPCLVVEVDNPEYRTTTRVVTEDCEVFLNEALAKLARQARKTKSTWARKAAWADFWNVKNTFAVLKSAYSLTVHRAQGSQFEHVVVDVRDILSNPVPSQGFRIFYTALTRATDRVTLIV